jgi:uridine kinase
MAFDPAVIAVLAARIEALDRHSGTLLVGIDGCGGAGKSTLARELATVVPHVSVVQFDDFYRSSADRSDEEIGGNFDWRRLRDQLLQPLANGETAHYQRYDWDGDELAEWHEIQPLGVLIVEGNYSTRSELRGFYDFTIWVDAPHDVRLRRGVQRDGEDSGATWLNVWMREEVRYVAAHRAAEHVDVVIDGAE